jgi:hypothetical protein
MTDRPDLTTETPANVTMRSCHFCEDIHPENLRVTRPAGRMYFCSDTCYQDWAKQAE